MSGAHSHMDSAQTTPYKVVLPFYIYASCSLLISTTLLFLSAPVFTQHYFQPHILAITHLMALGWGTMIILGASYQLIPVLIEESLYSNKMAVWSFILAAIGIPLLVHSFYTFNMGLFAKLGGYLIILSIILYLTNLAISLSRSKQENIHAVFVFTAGLWLLLTAAVGLLLIYNFTHPILSKNSVDYLPLHAHMGIAGWFLLLIVGVGSRLIPMFLISKYQNTKLLWWIFGLINCGLLKFLFLFVYDFPAGLHIVPVVMIASALLLFGYYCYQSYKQRMKKQVDAPVKTSGFSVLLMALPVMIMLVIISGVTTFGNNSRIVLVYGFAVFFGWITTIILGMTFKTLPFIVWNKVYGHQAASAKTPTPRDLFSNRIFVGMMIVYFIGFILFITAIFLAHAFLLRAGSLLLLLSALLYNFNVVKLISHKS